MFNLIHLLFCTVVNTNYNYAFILTFTNICIFSKVPIPPLVLLGDYKMIYIFFVVFLNVQ